MKRLRQWYRFTAPALVALLGLSAGCIIIPVESPVPAPTPAPLPPVATVPPPSPPVINFFTAKPEIVNPGQPVTLSWDVAKATAVSIQPTLDNVAPTGTTQVFPTADAAHTLIATNEVGSVTSFVTITVKPIDSSVSQQFVGVDPVTGRNEDIAFEWEQLCLSSEYQVQIAKDPGFTLLVFDSGIYAPSSNTSPAMLYLAGGRLEAGHTYFWRARVRQATTGQSILGPWSYPRRFTIGDGFPITTPFYGIQLLSPVNACYGYPVTSVPFNWAPHKGITRYQFTLARNPALTDIIAIAETTTTSYLYQGTLDYGTSYFWQVTAIQPASSDPSPVFTFSTEARPEPTTVPKPEAAEPPPTPLWVWVVIATGATLIAAVIILLLLVRQ